MRRIVSDRCAGCGLPFVMGREDVDFIKELKRRDLQRTLNFNYPSYIQRFEHTNVTPPEGEVTAENCDSIFLGEMIDIEMKCPKCGKYAFAEDDS